MSPEFLDYPFMRLALLAGIVLGALFSFMGMFVVTRGMSFFSDFIAHAAILGGAIALITGMDTTLFLIPYSLGLAVLVSAVWGYLPLSRDTVLGVFYGGTVALGIILIVSSGQGRVGLMQFLFGDILLLSQSDILISAGLLAAFLAFAGPNRKRLLKSVFLPEMAAAEGIGVKRYDYVLMCLMAVAIALSIKLVGVLLANAMIVIPAAAAKALSRSFRQFSIISPALGVASFTGGIVLSYYANLPSGPSVVACSFGFFIAAMLLRPLVSR